MSALGIGDRSSYVLIELDLGMAVELVKHFWVYLGGLLEETGI